MSRHNPIVLIDDDPEDLEFLQDGLTALGIQNPLYWIDDPEKAMDILLSMDPQPFLILCDLGMPKIDGRELKSMIDADERLREQATPFIFYSIYVDHSIVTGLYRDYHIQGVFQKAIDPVENLQMIMSIFEYWNSSLLPDSMQ